MKKVAVATAERPLRRESPQSMCPEVQPFDAYVRLVLCWSAGVSSTHLGSPAYQGCNTSRKQYRLRCNRYRRKSGDQLWHQRPKQRIARGHTSKETYYLHRRRCHQPSQQSRETQNTAILIEQVASSLMQQQCTNRRLNRSKHPDYLSASRPLNIRSPR